MINPDNGLYEKTSILEVDVSVIFFNCMKIN